MWSGESNRLLQTVVADREIAIDVILKMLFVRIAAGCSR